MKLVATVGACVALFALSGCAADHDDIGESDAELRAGGATLKSEDRRLTVKLEMLDGVQASTRDKRYTKATFVRGGKSFSLFCDALVSAYRGEDTRTEIRCSENTRGEDSDHLSVTVSRKGADLSLEVRASDPFGDHWQTVTGEAFEWVYGGPERTLALRKAGSGSLARDPLALLTRIENVVEGAIGRTVHLVGDGLDAHARLRSLSAHLENDMTLGFVTYFGSESSTVNVDPDDYLPKDISVLVTPGSLASGIGTERTLADRLEAALALE